MRIQYVDRSTNQIETEKVYGERALAYVYGDFSLARLLAPLMRHGFARIPFFSRLYGFLQKRRQSAKKIAPFIQAYHVDPTEFAEATFASFNDFFIRKLKPQARPLSSSAAILPADGRYFVFPKLNETTQFYIKDQIFHLAEFLQDPIYARRFQDGSMVIARLCPSDYHRFHFPCDGLPVHEKRIDGPLFSVNPIALRRRLSILFQNKRVVTEIDTDHFGTLLYIEVGATFVGSIHQTYPRDCPLSKGEEKGYFEFGGSCLVLLFERGRIAFDADLIANSAKGLETKALFGQSLGKCF